MAAPERRIGFMERVREQYETHVKLEELETEARREEIIQRIAEARARVEQELAIARRLETATVVEIEETFDYRGDGRVGLQVEGKEVNLGLNGSGAKVYKRTYRFSGWKGEPLPATSDETGDPAPAEPAPEQAATEPAPDGGQAAG